MQISFNYTPLNSLAKWGPVKSVLPVCTNDLRIIGGRSEKYLSVSYGLIIPHWINSSKPSLKNVDLWNY